MILENTLNLLAFVIFVAPFLLVESAEDPAFNDDVLGLIVFKASLTDPESKLSSWNEDDDTPCNWCGVQCDPTSNRVTHLVLDDFSLSGHMGRSLVRLQHLQLLSLSNNNFTGPMNPILTSIPSLSVVDLSGNGFSGPIPDQLFQQCTSLTSISLANNYLTGSIPDSLTSCSSLEMLNFSMNQLSAQLPYGLWSLASLRSLDLSANLLQGQIPEDIGKLQGVRDVNLSKNKFNGVLPEGVGNCLALKSLDLSENALSGSLPVSIQKLSSCTCLRLSGNFLTGELPDWSAGMITSLEILDLSANDFSGRIPDSIGNIQFLKQLNLSRNQFMGSLPESLRNCGGLEVMDVGQNMLTGNLPSWIFKMGLTSLSLSGNRFSGVVEHPPLLSMTASFQHLQVLDLSCNALSGEISPVIGNFSSLQVFNMSRNYLVGHLPASIGQLNATKVLDLSHNNLTGSIPSEIGGAISLQQLRLQRNAMTGRIPTEIQHCSSLTTLYLSHNNLTGPIPAAIANLINLEIVDLSFNHFTGSLPKELTNLSHLTAFNISHNKLEGELPVDGFFNTIPASSVTGNPSLCGSIVNHSCPSVHPKPIVLNPNSPDSSHGPLSPNFRHKRIILSISSLVAIGAAVLIAIGVIIVTILNMHVRSSMMRSASDFALSGGGDDLSQSPQGNYGKLVLFSEKADFAAGPQALLRKECELGRGGFGAVYRTELQDGHAVAIKKLNVSGFIKGQEEFEREVRMLGKIRHQNLVALEGYYWTPSLQLLINEYVGGGSLYRRLHDDSENFLLSWQHRFNIILGTAKGLAELHRLNIIHYNIKSNNVMIDDQSGDAKVADFGLARLLPSLDRYILSSKIQSALGYMAPEFACQTVKITDKCDVYGFGVLSLEVVTGKRPVEYMEDDVIVLCDTVRGALEEGRVEECVDSRLGGNFLAEEVIPVMKLGLICASQVPSNRPDMDEVIKILELIHSPSSSPSSETQLQEEEELLE